jgi:hypothetical protein
MTFQTAFYYLFIYIPYYFLLLETLFPATS